MLVKKTIIYPFFLLVFLLSQCGKPKPKGSGPSDLRLSSKIYVDSSDVSDANLQIITLNGRIKSAGGGSDSYKNWGVMLKNKSEHHNRVSYLPLKDKTFQFSGQFAADLIKGYTLFLVDPELKIKAQLVETYEQEKNPAYILGTPPKLLTFNRNGQYLTLVTEDVKTITSSEKVNKEFSLATNPQHGVMLSYAAQILDKPDGSKKLKFFADIKSAPQGHKYTLEVLGAKDSFTPSGTKNLTGNTKIWTKTLTGPPISEDDTDFTIREDEYKEEITITMTPETDGSFKIDGEILLFRLCNLIGEEEQEDPDTGEIFNKTCIDYPFRFISLTWNKTEISPTRSSGDTANIIKIEKTGIKGLDGKEDSIDGDSEIKWSVDYLKDDSPKDSTGFLPTTNKLSVIPLEYQKDHKFRVKVSCDKRGDDIYSLLLETTSF